MALPLFADVLTTAQRICKEYEQVKIQGRRLPWNCTSLYVLMNSLWFRSSFFSPTGRFHDSHLPGQPIRVHL